jgi:hypothetical protein
MSKREWGIAMAICLSLWAPAQAADKTDEKTLQAVRQALVDAAMNANTRVSAHSWMDTQGALREVNRFTSDIQLQGLRVQGGANAPQVEVLGVQSTPSASPSCRVPSAKSSLRQMMGLQVSLAPELPMSQRLMARQLQRAIQARLNTLATEWRHLGVVREPQIDNTYLRELAGRGQHRVPWQLQILVAPGDLDGGEGLNVLWRVVHPARQQVLSQGAVPVAAPIENLYGDAPMVDGRMLAMLDQGLSFMGQQLENKLSCETQGLSVAKGPDGSWVVPAGHLAGLRVGDRLVLADDRVIPAHVLEPAALDQLVLAEVKSVSAYQSEIKPLPSKKKMPNVGWVAWPYTF